MNKISVLGTGLNGLVGSRIVEVLQDTYTFKNISRSTGVDITDRNQVLSTIFSSDAPLVIHLTAKTDVDGCEKDRNLGENGEAWKINVNGTRHVADACKKTGKKFIYISTDFVFDGKNPPSDGYMEEDTTHPINWYGITKAKGEEIVRSSGLDYLVVRVAFPYGRPFEKKKDFVQAILGRLRIGQTISGVSDQQFMPTFIDDIAKALDVLIRKNATGTYHVIGGSTLSPYDALLTIAETFNFDTSLIQKTTAEEFFKGRAPRPYNLILKHDKIEKLGVKLRSFEEGLRLIKNQLDNL